MKKQYETVFILTPVLSEAQMKDAVQKFKGIITDGGAKIINDEDWGLKKLAYPIQHKTTGFYHLFEFEAEPSLIQKLETEYRRDEKVMRFLTTVLDKHAIVYNERRRKGEFNKPKAEKEEVTS
ncbi:MAG: 30S ribosomal protein S6 [Cyclobacteriaceae bacterium]|nr:30S ribosomal protein S6 [Cyclobacteriaceae bacterium SS2]